MARLLSRKCEESPRATIHRNTETYRMNLATQVAGYAALILFCAVLLNFSCTTAHAARDAWREHQAHPVRRAR